MNALNPASLINLLGFTVGVALYALLLAMVVRHRRAKSSFDFLLLAAAGLLPTSVATRLAFYFYRAGF